MAGSVKRPRTYDRTRRQAQARQTRMQVLRAAHDLFVAQGYARTTIADVARTAGVSTETIYSTFRNKTTLLHRVWDVTIGGDDADVVFHERPEVRALRAEPNLSRRLELHAEFYAQTAQRIVPFLLALEAAAGADPVAAEMLSEIGRQRLAGMEVMAADAAATGQLRVSEEECRDVMWSTTDGMLWHRLVQQRGWTNEEFAVWLARLWEAALVA